MPRRHILNERQRSTLFDLPTDEASLLNHYTLDDDDLGHIRERRRSENRMGFALQLCALRYPGRILYPGELIPKEVISFRSPNWNHWGCPSAVVERIPPCPEECSAYWTARRNP